MEENYQVKLELTEAQQELIRANQDAILKQMENNTASPDEEIDMLSKPVMGGRPSTLIINKCNFDIHCTQSWGGIPVREGMLAANGGTAYYDHDVQWYDYKFISCRGRFTRYFIAAGGKIVVTADCF